MWCDVYDNDVNDIVIAMVILIMMVIILMIGKTVIMIVMVIMVLVMIMIIMIGKWILQSVCDGELNSDVSYLSLPFSNHFVIEISFETESFNNCAWNL